MDDQSIRQLDAHRRAPRRTPRDARHWNTCEPSMAPCGAPAPRRHATAHPAVASAASPICGLEFAGRPRRRPRLLPGLNGPPTTRALDDRHRRHHGRGPRQLRPGRPAPSSTRRLAPADGGCCGPAGEVGFGELALRRGRSRVTARGRRAGQPRLRQPDRGRRAPPRRGRARPRVGRRHRRPAVRHSASARPGSPTAST